MLNDNAYQHGFELGIQWTKQEIECDWSTSEEILAKEEQSYISDLNFLSSSGEDGVADEEGIAQRRGIHAGRLTALGYSGYETSEYWEYDDTKHGVIRTPLGKVYNVCPYGRQTTDVMEDRYFDTKLIEMFTQQVPVL